MHRLAPLATSSSTPSVSADPTTRTGALAPLVEQRSLLARFPDGRVETYALPRRGVLVLGRDPSVDLVLRDDSVSRRHARLTVDGDAWLEDAGSKNGLSVGGVALAGRRRRIEPGEPFAAGEVHLMLVVANDSDRAVPLSLASHAAANAGYLARQLPIVDRIARTDLTVLVTGETGVGKDVFAELLHARSHRSAAPFVRIHCGALSPSLVESELFGHERGAFTDATSGRAGLLETADGGTAFLDEIGEISQAVQVKLLRVLEDGRITRVGASRSTRVDVRFVAATHRDLAKEVEAGRFRRDLFYRLGGMRFHVPPLRERRDELPEIVRVIVGRSAEREGKPAPPIDPSLLDAIGTYSFPGNIRELRNVVERAYVLSGGQTLTGAHVTGLIERRPSAPPPAMLASDDDPRARIVAALERCAGNQTRAAQLLGVSRRTLVSWLAVHRIPRPTD